MLNIIAIIIFILSFLGMGIMIYRKGSVLAQYSPEPDTRPSAIGILREKVKNKLVPDELFWQKTLSKIRILVLKTDNKTSEWMRKLREKSVQSKTKFSDNYWEKLRK